MNKCKYEKSFPYCYWHRRCSLGWPATSCVAQASFESKLPSYLGLPSARIPGTNHHTLPHICFRISAYIKIKNKNKTVYEFGTSNKSMDWKWSHLSPMDLVQQIILALNFTPYPLHPDRAEWGQEPRSLRKSCQWTKKQWPTPYPDTRYFWTGHKRLFLESHLYPRKKWGKIKAVCWCSSSLETVRVNFLLDFCLLSLSGNHLCKYLIVGFCFTVWKTQ